MTPFEILLVAHFVGDMIVAQTAYEAHHKAHLWCPCITHATKWTLVIALASLLAGWRGDTPFAVLLVMTGVFHALIDRRWPVLWLIQVFKGEKDPPDWLVMWIDQVLHVVQVAILATLI